MSWVGDAAGWLWEVVKWPPWWQIGLGMGILASVPALIGFVFWVAEQRRRPEIKFLWKVSISGSDDNFSGWDPTQEPEVPPSSRIVIEASVQNVGDAATRRAMTNLVAPVSVEIKQIVGSARSPIPTVVAGHPISFVSDTFELPPGTWKMQRFELIVPEQAQGIRIVFKLADQALNASGSRWFPSRLVGADDADLTSYRDPWPPPRPRLRRQWKRIRAKPHGRVWCVRGERADVRDIRIASDAHDSPLLGGQPAASSTRPRR